MVFLYPTIPPHHAPGIRTANDRNSMVGRVVKDVGNRERGVMFKMKRAGLVLALAAALLCLVVGIGALIVAHPWAAKWLASCGLLATVAGVVQLDVSGLFERVLAIVSDRASHPHGPPSSITRQLIDNPDSMVLQPLSNWLFAEPRTGFWLIVGGTLVQVLAVWL